MLQFTSELLSDILFRGREILRLNDPISNTDWADQALVYLNRAYYALAFGGREFLPPAGPEGPPPASAEGLPLAWSWLRKSPPGSLTLVPAITTGTVTVTNNSTTITFSSAPATTSIAQYFFKVTTHADVFRIATHTAASTTATLGSFYTGISGSGLTYTAMPLQYELAGDVLRLLPPLRAYRSNGVYANDTKIHLIDLALLDDEYPLQTITGGVPTRAARIGETTLRMNRYPGTLSTDLLRVEYEYLRRPPALTAPGTTEEPLVPLEHRSVLVDMALYFLALDKNDDRVQAYAADARNGVVALLREQRMREAPHEIYIEPRGSAGLRFTRDLLADILFRGQALLRLGASLSQTDWSAQALVYLNRAYSALALGGREFLPAGPEQRPVAWGWLRKAPPGVLTLLPGITAGTVTVTNNSTTITFSSAPSVSVAGRFFQTTDHADVFRIATHTAASTTATLDSVYTGLTGAGRAYKVVQLDYALASDVLRVLAPLRIHRSTGSYWHANDNKIHLIDLTVMEDEYPLHTLQAGAPNRAAFVGETTLRMNRSGGTLSTDLIRVDYEYLFRPVALTFPGTTEEPLVPLEHRSVLVDMALYFLALDKNDDRVQAYAADARNGVVALLREQSARHATADMHFGKIMPLAPRGRKRGVWMSTSGRLLGW